MQAFEGLATSEPRNNIHGYFHDLSWKGIAPKNPHESPSSAYNQHNSHREQIPYIPLTTRVLDEHNLQQEHISRSPRAQYISRYDHVNISRDTVFQGSDTVRAQASEGTGEFNSSVPDATSLTQSFQESNPTAYDEVGWNIAGYQSTSRWQLRPVDQDNIANNEMDPGRHLADWAHDLAGVGEQFVDYNCDECYIHGELVVD
jgi:hypothetical protein